MRFAVSIVAYNEGRYILPCLRQIPRWVEKVLLIADENPWGGERAKMAHLTFEHAHDYCDGRVEIQRRIHFSTEHLARTWSLGRLYDFDWVIILDADEFYTPEDWGKMKDALENASSEADVMRCEFITYWKDFEHRFEPPDRHRGIIAVNPKHTVFNDRRETVEQMSQDAPVFCHHLSWVRDDDEVWQKIQNWEHRYDFDLNRWFNKVWKAWEPNMVGIRPYGDASTMAVPCKLPNSIRGYFDDTMKL